MQFTSASYLDVRAEPAPVTKLNDVFLGWMLHVMATKLKRMEAVKIN